MAFMEQELVLGAAATFGGVIGGWLFLKPLKEPLPPMSPKAKTGFYYAGVFLIGLGLINLLYGFLDNELFVSGRYGGYVGWLNYDGHKRLFAWFGFLSSFSIFFGVGCIRVNLLSETKK